MEIVLIFASDLNGIIGKDNALPWKQKADLMRFKQLTMGYPMLMGRRTFESLPKLLPGRPHLILTKNKSYSTILQNDMVHYMYSMHEAISWAKENAFDHLYVVGGAQLFDLSIDHATKIFHTKIHAKVEGDVSWKIPDSWQCSASTFFPADTENQYPYSFETYLPKSLDTK